MLLIDSESEASHKDHKGKHAAYIGMGAPFTSERPRRLCWNGHSAHFGMATPFGRNLQQKMGAIINVNGNQITITPSELKKYEGNLPALDVRSAAVTLVASIVSRSHVDIIDAHHIFRGYSRLKQNMQELGIELVCDIS